MTHKIRVGDILWRIAVLRRSSVLLVLLLLSFVGIADMEKMLATMQRYGGSAPLFHDWRQLIDHSRALGTQDKLRRVNEFFNRKIQFADDINIWGQTEYWATPIETLAKGRGDCEDFTIAKYFTLREAGFSNEQLRLIYVKAKIGGAASKITQAHMVLAYYPQPDAEPLILDNLITEIRPASRRPDLQPIFSFNSQGIWAAGATGATGATGAAGAIGGHSANSVPGAGVGRLTRWQELLGRVKAEGLDFKEPLK